MAVPMRVRLSEHHRATPPAQHLNPELPCVPRQKAMKEGYTPEPPAGGRRAGGGCAASRVRWEAGVVKPKRAEVFASTQRLGEGLR